MFFSKKIKDGDCCRYCKYVQEENGEYICKSKGNVKPDGVCRRYVFNPFAHRVPRLRTLDTTMFDPLDFKLD